MNEFKTRELGLAALLSYVGYVHLRTEKIGYSSTHFVFDDFDGNANQIERNYFEGCAVADAQRLIGEYRAVKATMAHVMQSGEVWKADVT